MKKICALRTVAIRRLETTPYQRGGAAISQRIFDLFGWHLRNLI